jgi:hypothetical protein
VSLKQSGGELTYSMSAQNKGEVILTFFYFRYIYIIKNSNMKSKLFLEEGEISRILNMHKKAIQEQINVNGDEVENNQVQMDEELYEGNELMESVDSFTLPADYSLESDHIMSWSEGIGIAELKMFRGATFKIDGKGILKAKTKYQFVDTIDGSVYKPGDDYEANFKVAVDGNGTISGTITYSCGQGKFYSNYDVSKLYFDEDGKLVPKLNKLCQASKTQTPTNNNKKVNTATQSKCPKIEKSFLDKGYVMITQKRYQELANDKTRVRKYAWCPISKTNLFFGKVIQGTPEKDGWSKDTRGNGRGDGRGNGSGGGSVSFDYDSVIKAINDKCPGGGGGNANLDIDIDGEKVVPTPKMPTDVFNTL